jgi:ABC-type thiamine transport system substrate-binding protein
MRVDEKMVSALWNFMMTTDFQEHVPSPELGHPVIIK